MRKHRLPFLLCCLATAAPQAIAQKTGEISGLVSDESGSPVSSVRLAIVRQYQPGWAGAWTSSTATARNGAYRFENLAAGRYTICVETTGSGYLNPCEWGYGSGLAFDVGSEARVNFPIALRVGFLIAVEVSDPAGLLDEHETKKTPNASFALGVVSPQGMWRAAVPRGKSKNKREYACWCRGGRP